MDRYRQCREGQGRTFLLDYSYAGQSPEIKEQIVEMAMNASGIRDTARVLKISPTLIALEPQFTDDMSRLKTLLARSRRKRTWTLY